MALQELDAKTNHSGSSHKNFGILKKTTVSFFFEHVLFSDQSLNLCQTFRLELSSFLNDLSHRLPQDLAPRTAEVFKASTAGVPCG